MIKDVGLGLRILGYGTAGVIFLYLVDVVPKCWIIKRIKRIFNKLSVIEWVHSIGRLDR
jgi:chromate transport protein ChrA